MERLNRHRTPVVLVILVLFLLLLGFYMWGLKPTFTRIDEQRADMERIEGERDLLQQKVDEMKGTDSDSETERSSESLVALPHGDEADQLVLDLRSLGLKSDARLKNVDFTLTGANELNLMLGEGENAYPFIKEVKMNAEVEGTYSQISDWMIQLERLPRMIKVDSYSFQRRGGLVEAPENALITANIVFTAYYESAQVGSPASGAAE
ncbi:type 4a pilus biogenesis protein PilO [Paenibacillus lemnae]|uniref:Type 4a pilus biogenesis protein PilO n=1 Tax=Paenibacillus lemnae TaxID=1330551 RepID=A0A848M687_PAELE|nr:type 4a pilus biogenesis protein PilO [Paenibacillus lemnae]NMO96668.1 type 4a pilus biogenesis protein PilO [Paenibacillus lemnae]